VLVVVITVRGVPVPVMDVIQVMIVWLGLVPAAWSVQVVMTGMGQMRQRMLVVVTVVRHVRVALVYVVDVSLPLHARMPAAGAVHVGVFLVSPVVCACHGSSLLCCTASATIWATC
jgi:hypothetical protein